MRANTQITYHDFLRLVSKDTGFTITAIDEALKSAERCIAKCLSDATPDNSVAVKYFKHAEAIRKYIKPTDRTMPNGAKATCGGKMKTSTRFTEKLKNLDVMDDDNSKENSSVDWDFDF